MAPFFSGHGVLVVVLMLVVAIIMFAHNVSVFLLFASTETTPSGNFVLTSYFLIYKSTYYLREHITNLQSLYASCVSQASFFLFCLILFFFLLFCFYVKVESLIQKNWPIKVAFCA